MKLFSSLTHDDAVVAAEAALLAARQRGLCVTVAVVDAAGQLLRLDRMEGARAYSLDLAQRKARTAASIGYPTSALAEALKGQPMSAEVLAVAGGLPVRLDGDVAGAIGVSGARADEDDAVAAAGLAAIDGQATATARTP